MSGKTAVVNEQILGIETNVKLFGYAPITNGAFGTPIITKRNLISASNNVEQSSKPIRGDGAIKMTIQGPKKRNAEITLLQVSKEYAELALGYKTHANGGMSDTGMQSPHCIFYMTEETSEANVKTDVLHYLYNVTASIPSEEHAQDEDDPTPVNLVIPYACIPSDIAKDANNNPTSYFKLARTAANATLFDTYTSKIIVPSDAVPAV